jgi:hypothetical protein
MGTKLSKKSISELMRTWGRKGGCRATDKQKSAALENLKKTPNYQKSISRIVDTVHKCTEAPGGSDRVEPRPAVGNLSTSESNAATGKYVAQSPADNN